MKAKIFLMLGILFLFGIEFSNAQEEVLPVRMFFFHSDGCPHCRAEEEYIKKLEDKYPNLQVYEYEVSSEFKNINIFRNIIEHYKTEGAVPVTIIKNRPLIGFDSEEGQFAGLIEDEILYCSKNACDPYPVELLGLEKVGKEIPEPENSDSANDNDKQENRNVSVFGKELNISENTSLVFLAFVLGLADGVNPCMFSVLIFMLTYLMSIGSTKKAIKAGTAFALVTFLVYFLFMLGIIRVIDILQIANQARTVIIIVALFAGILMIKDFFFYGKGLSLEIPSRYKPKLEALTKRGTIPSVILLAFLASLVELPCTSGLPLAYVSILAGREVPVVGHLILYNLFFILPLVLIIVGVAFAWSRVEDVEAWREKTKRYMRLIAGTILVFLAIALWKNWL